ncbi:Leukocyte receptor cluster member 1 [Linnemannia zychae]|nr:Leukocyte receptor cluster member 1 [Linnemannia zychae]
MNILQHKSWHVYSQKNQDRVKRDEAKAEAEEKKTQRRAIAADQEHRLMILRQRAAKRYANVPGIEDGEDIDAHSDALIPIANDTVAVAKPKSEHDTASKKGNPEYEAEQKAKERKWERTIAVHLDSANSGPTPWYTTPGAGSMTATSKKSGDTSFSKIQEDPLQNMRTMLDKRKISLEKKDKRERSRSPTSRKHARTSDYSRSIVKEMPTGMSTMAKLRMERLLREQEEKTKAMLLVNPDYIDPAGSGNGSDTLARAKRVWELREPN